MTPEVVISVNNLGKSYRIYNHPRDRLKQALCRGRKQYFREFWALRGISFEVRRGETLGIIGRNGSGKSTLLQMICGTLTPSEGNVKTTGRIGALLELGSGFNPEFTGIENIGLNGSLLGMSQAEVESRMDDILAFADIGDFIDQPVKTYSSGMALRLAFAVLAHSDPEVLVVDEALSVGDAAFTQKCMRFIRKIRDNHVLLYVSHDPASISSLCNQVLWLHQGRERGHGDVRQILDLYSKDCYASNQETDLNRATNANIPLETSESSHHEDTYSSASPVEERTDPIATVNDRSSGSQPWPPFSQCSSKIEYGDNCFGDGAILIRKVALINKNAPDQPLKRLSGGEEMQLSVLAECLCSVEAPSICGFIVRNKLGLTLFGENTFKQEQPEAGAKPETGQWLLAQIEFTMPSLQSGSYMMSLGWASGSQESHIQNCYINDLLELEFETSTSRIVHGLFACPTSALSLKIC